MPFDAAKRLLRAWVNARVEEGCYCPACGIKVKQYKVKMNRTYVRALTILTIISERDADEDGWFKVGQSEIGKRLAHDLNHMKYSKLRYFKVIESMGPGHNRNPWVGFWRITSRGRDFLAGRRTVRAYVREVHKTARRFSRSRVNVNQAKGVAFDFDEEVLGIESQYTELLEDCPRD